MAIKKDSNPHVRRTNRISVQADRPGRFAWLRSRPVLVLGIVLMGVILVIFANSRFQASHDQVAQAAQPQNDLSAPRAYQFTGQGKVMGGSGGTWIIGGVPVVVSNQTQIEGDVHPGDEVSVLGHITKDGKWLAEGINPISEDDSFFSFAGPVESRTPTIWKVAGISLTINAQTHLGESIEENELVLATFKVLPDGTWEALNIDTLSSSPVSATPAPTLTPTQAATPTPSPTSLLPLPADQPVVSGQESPSIKPGGQKDKSPASDKGNGKGKGKDKGCYLQNGDNLIPCPSPGNGHGHGNGHGNGDQGDNSD